VQRRSLVREDSESEARRLQALLSLTQMESRASGGPGRLGGALPFTAVLLLGLITLAALALVFTLAVRNTGIPWILNVVAGGAALTLVVLALVTARAVWNAGEAVTEADQESKSEAKAKAKETVPKAPAA
jgi:uncharacterized membrane protein YedE/YeeE